MRDTTIWLGLILSMQSLACSPQSSSPPPEASDIIFVNVSNIPSRAVKLEIKGTLNGKPAMNPAELDPPAARFYMRLPELNGNLALDATAVDSDGCLHGTGQAQVNLPSPLAEVSLAIAAQTPRKCGSVEPCSSGAICSETVKPTTSPLYGMFAISPTDIWAVGAAGTTIHYDGTSWTRVAVPGTYSGYYLNAVWASGPNDVWAVGEVGLLLRYNGSSWALSPNAAMYDLNGIWGWSPTNIMTCGSQGYCYRWNGSSWVDASPTGSIKLNSVWGASPTDIWVAAASGTIYRFTSGWTSQAAPGSTVDLLDVWGRSANQVFMVGGNQTILSWDGASWRRVNSAATGVNLNAIIGNETGFYAVGNNGTFLQSQTVPFDTWTLMNSGISANLFGVSIDSNGLGWVVGATGYLGRYDARP